MNPKDTARLVYDGLIELAAREAETNHGGGPSTKCPNCGEEHSLTMAYLRGRSDAGQAVRKLKKGLS